MPGSNTTGTPNTADYLLGRGIISFSAIDGTTGLPSTGYRDLGNCPDFTITLTVETFEHKSSRGGLKTIDKEITVSQDAEIKFTIEELNHENYALFLSGSQSTYTNPAVAGFTTDPLVADGNLALGRYYDIRTAAGVRAYDIDKTKVTITSREGSPVTMVEGTDYTTDEKLGTIFILSTSTKMATAIAANKGLKVVMAADAGAFSPVQQVDGLTTTTIAGALKFKSINPANSDSVSEIQFHKVSLKADGDASLIGDENAKLSMKCKCEKNTGTAFGSGKTMTVTYAGG